MLFSFFASSYLRCHQCGSSSLGLICEETCLFDYWFFVCLMSSYCFSYKTSDFWKVMRLWIAGLGCCWGTHSRFSPLPRRSIDGKHNSFCYSL